MQLKANFTSVKVCGITRLEDAIFAVSCGARALGFIFYDGSPRFLNIDQAKRIVEVLPPFVSSVALFVNPNAYFVRKVISDVAPDLIQFHGEEPPKFCEQFDRPYIKALRVHQSVNLIQLAKVYLTAKAILLDSFVEGKLGGTGKTFDWSVIPPDFSKPIILAGGLNPSNVRTAITAVRPWAVDVSSGVELVEGIKDPQKMLAFFKGVKDANE